jgi:hypothetical protein
LLDCVYKNCCLAKMKIVRLEVSTAVFVSTQFFWDLTLCRCVAGLVFALQDDRASYLEDLNPQNKCTFKSLYIYFISHAKN